MNQAVDYVLPLRWHDDDDLDELTAYLRWLRRYARVIVVDGSPPAVFDRHAVEWIDLCTHVPPTPDSRLNGKVTGVHTGLALARADSVVIADDDVRYDEESLRRTVALLEHADLVGPQNVFDPMPWHAAWDTARSLLNRAVTADYPGTFAIRRATFVRMGGYDGDVLFENLELMRTVRAAGGRVVRPRDIYVVRRPPSARRFLDQRTRQAFDDFAQPWRLATFLPVVPLLASSSGRRIVLRALLASVALAELGRRRDGGCAVFPLRASLFAPAWVLERSVCSWVALGQRVFFGGVRYADQRLCVAAHSPRTLRRRLSALVAARSTEADGAVGAVAERPTSGPPTSAEGDRPAPAIDLLAVGPDDAEAAAHEQRSVLVRRDHGFVGRVVFRHGDHRARRTRSETGRIHA